MAFCLSLAVMWQLAEFAAQRDQLFEEHYAMEAENPFTAGLRDAPPGHQHHCSPWSQECRQFRCEHSESSAMLYSRLQ